MFAHLGTVFDKYPFKEILCLFVGFDLGWLKMMWGLDQYRHKSVFQYFQQLVTLHLG